MDVIVIVFIICFSRSPRDGPFIIIGCPSVSSLLDEPNWDVFMIVATSFASFYKNNNLKRGRSDLGAVL